jgi:hypothetical protein
MQISIVGVIRQSALPTECGRIAETRIRIGCEQYLLISRTSRRRRDKPAKVFDSILTGALPPIRTSDRARSPMRMIDFDGNEHPINIAPINEGSEAMRGDPTDRRQHLASWLLVLLILALVAIALHDVM